MHEIAAMQGVVRTVLDCMRAAGASRVTHVQLVLGVSGHFTADAAHQSFEVLTRGTLIEGASLSIQWVPAQYQCFSCLHRFESGEPSEQVTCPQCGEVALEVEHQDICSVSSINVSFHDEADTTDLLFQMLLEQQPGSSLVSRECAAPLEAEEVR